MYFVPLTQFESVELVIHVLRNANGDTCIGCPAKSVCMRQCETVGNAIQELLISGNLPQIGNSDEVEEEVNPPVSENTKFINNSKNIVNLNDFR